VTTFRAPPAGFDDRDTDGPLWLRIDASIILLAIGLLCIGVVVVYSATRGVLNPEEDIANTSFLRKQLVFVAIGGVLAMATAAIDYRKVRGLAPFVYVGAAVALIGLFFFGTDLNTFATSWYSLGFITIQPSEFAKLALILALASWFSSVQSRDGLQFVNVLMGLALAGGFAFLVLLQPDFGTVMVYAAVVAGVVLVAGVAMRHVLLVLGVVSAAIAIMIRSGYLLDAQINRFTSFVDPENAARYNVNQSEIAIGNGGLSGEGLFQGSQNNNSLVPEKESDFIFSVLGEEFGFLGGAVLLALFALLLLRIWRVAHLAEDEYGRLICVGVFSMFLFQAFQSIGMNMGMMPVTGIPLPLISYGGSSMLTSLMALGLVESVHAHRLR